MIAWYSCRCGAEFSLTKVPDIATYESWLLAVTTQHAQEHLWRAEKAAERKAGQ